METISKEEFQKDMREYNRTYPVGNATFSLFSDSDRIVGKYNFHGVTLYKVKQVDKPSNVEIVFYIYKHPVYRTNFTEIGQIPIDLDGEAEP